ncbi:hypothetical protein POTOM_028839 [Populus tomentosa]|uniref:Uncharacterized protein n=1 Tax=Populus tomentosa TaxID=118781 RepID=A0A8X7ZH91_POPTO|nr:hypothetical protein POTOM_028839 [Populus tomentosa]
MSTIFTGVYGYVVGVFWLLGGIAYGGFLLATAFCCKTRRTASGLVLGGNAKFRSRAKNAADIIIDTANDAWKTMYNTTGVMKDIKENLGVSKQRAAARASSFLTTTSAKLDAEAADIQRRARKNRHLIDKGLKIVLWNSEVTATTVRINCCVLDPDCSMLAVLWAVFLLRKMLSLNDDVAGDVALTWQSVADRGRRRSILLLCRSLMAGRDDGLLWFCGGAAEDDLVSVDGVNAHLSTMQGVPYTVCNPFSAPPEYQYQPDKCPANTIGIGEIPQVLKVLTCSSFDNGTFANGQFISPNYYRTVEAYSTSIQSLLNVYPEMENLVQFMVFLVLIWTMLAQHEQEHHSLDGSVKPRLPSVAKELETGTKDSSEHTVSV